MNETAKDALYGVAAIAIAFTAGLAFVLFAYGLTALFAILAAL